MICRLLVVAAAIGISEQGSIFDNACGCPKVDTYPTATAAYCPTSNSALQTCNSSLLVEDSCTVSCPGERQVFTFRNGSSVGAFSYTDYVKCVNGEYYNAANVKVVNFNRPTCGIKYPCDKCSTAAMYETTCPTGSSCNTDNYKITREDGCTRISCANTATLTAYDRAKNIIPTSGLYCGINSNWYNFSISGAITNGAKVGDGVNITANCRLSTACETCVTPNFVTNPVTQMPVAFRTGYKTVTPTITRQAAQCSTITCPNAYLLMGFKDAVTNNQTGLEFLSNQFGRCSDSGLWTNAGSGNIPQNLYLNCMQKINACPPVDTVLGNSFTLACNEQIKVSTITCPTALPKLVMRYMTATGPTIKYDSATFFEGKGWLAHGCDATANIFTTVQGQQVWATCTTA